MSNCTQPYELIDEFDPPPQIHNMSSAHQLMLLLLGATAASCIGVTVASGACERFEVSIHISVTIA